MTEDDRLLALILRRFLADNYMHLDGPGAGRNDGGGMALDGYVDLTVDERAAIERVIA